MSAVVAKPRLGFLGLGWIGRLRLDALEASGEVEVAGVADPAIAGALESLDDLLELPLDGVVIATPNALHGEQAIAALEHGVAVFCQKPLARSASEARDVVDAARGADALLAVDLSYRHVEAFRRARELVREGMLGDVFALDLVFHNAYGPDKEWFYDPRLSGGGCLIDLGTHLVDLALWTLGEEADVRSSRLVGDEVEEYATAELDVGGAAVRLACSWKLHAGAEAVIGASFYGREGAVSVRNVNGSFYDFAAELHRGTARESLVGPPDDWGGRAALNWSRRLARDPSFDPEIESAVQVAAIVDDIYGR